MNGNKIKNKIRNKCILTTLIKNHMIVFHFNRGDGSQQNPTDENDSCTPTLKVLTIVGFLQPFTAIVDLVREIT